MFKHRVQRLEALKKRYAAQRREPAQASPRPLETGQDVIDLLLGQIETLSAAVWARPVEKARAIGYLAEIVRRTQQTEKLADRLKMLEQVLKQRKGEAPR